MKVTIAGNPITLVGKRLQVGDKAPDFKLLDNNNEVKTLDSFKGYKIINIVTSLDTGVCDAQARKFNVEVKDIPVVTVSYDLPPAQARWCGGTGLDNVITLSTHLDNDFAINYGVFLEDIRLSIRAVLILDENNVVKYVDYVSEVVDHPNYDDALDFINSISLN